MPISGLVITLDAGPTGRRQLLDVLSRHPALHVGAGDGARLAVAADTASEQEDRQLWEWLHRLDGVRFVDLVYVAFDGLDDRPPAPRAQPQKAGPQKVGPQKVGPQKAGIAASGPRSPEEEMES